MRTLRTIVEACTDQPLLPLTARAGNRQEENQDQRGVEGDPRPVAGNQQSSVKENLTTSLAIREVIAAARVRRHQPIPEEHQLPDRHLEEEHHHPIVLQEGIPQHQDPTARRHVSTTSPEIVLMTNAHSYTLEEKGGEGLQLGDQLPHPH
jgi:hypothetical protein